MFNTPINRNIATKLHNINQQYVNRLKKLEGGNIFDDIYETLNDVTRKITHGVTNIVHDIGLDGSGMPMKKYVKGSYKGGRTFSTSTNLPTPTPTPTALEKDEIVPFKQINNTLPQLTQVPLSNSNSNSNNNKNWFEKAKDMVYSFFGNGKSKKPTKKQIGHIQKLFKKQGHVIGGDFWDGLANWGKDQLKQQGDNAYAKAGLEGIKDLGYGKPKKPTKKQIGGDFWDGLSNWGKDQLKQQGDNAYAKAGLEGLKDLGYGKPKKVNARALIVKRIMHEKGCSMIEASKYIKQHNITK